MDGTTRRWANLAHACGVGRPHILRFTFVRAGLHLRRRRRDPEELWIYRLPARGKHASASQKSQWAHQ